MFHDVSSNHLKSSITYSPAQPDFVFGGFVMLIEFTTIHFPKALMKYIEIQNEFDWSTPMGFSCFPMQL